MLDKFLGFITLVVIVATVIMFVAMTWAVVDALFLDNNSASLSLERIYDEAPVSEYSIFYVEGMPCLWAESVGGQAGLSCDWSRWDSE